MSTPKPQSADTPILSVVWQKAGVELSHFDYKKKVWIEKGKPYPVNQYIGSGGHMSESLQKAQVFGFSRKAKERLAVYRRDPRLYEVRPILLQEV